MSQGTFSSKSAVWARTVIRVERWELGWGWGRVGGGGEGAICIWFRVLTHCHITVIPNVTGRG